MGIMFDKIGSISIVIAAKYIEDGSIVTKKNGSKEYTLRRNIKIYGEKQQIIKCNDEMIFIIDSDGNINQISENTELIVDMMIDDAYSDLDYYFNNYMDESK